MNLQKDKKPMKNVTKLTTNGMARGYLTSYNAKHSKGHVIFKNVNWLPSMKQKEQQAN